MNLFTARDDTTDQPSATPTRKVGAAGAWGLLVVLVLAALSTAGIEVPGVDPEGLPVGEAFTGLVMFVSAYLTREFR